MDERFGNIIRNRRKALKLTVKFVIEALEKLHGVNISASYVTRIELHGEIPSPMLTRKLSKLLSIDEAQLLSFARKEKLEYCIASINRSYK